MYLFSRTRTAKSTHFRKAAAFAAEIRDVAAAKTGFDVSAHTVLFGKPTGTFTWATLVPGRAAFVEATAKLLTDSEYLDLVEKGSEHFLDDAHDYFRQIVQLDGLDPDGAAPSLSQAWTAQISNGQYDHALDWGTDIATYVHELTGAPMATLADAYGSFGTLTWIATFDSAEECDRATEVLNQDPEWVKRINYAEDLFLPGSGRVWLNRRLD